MDKPTAKTISVSKSKKKPPTYHQQKVLNLCESTISNVLSFPLAKYYSGTYLSLCKAQKNITSAGLMEFLEELGISGEIAKHYFHEVHVYNKKTREKLRTLGFPNEDDGFELISPFFKGTVGTQTISFMRGTIPKPESLHIFPDSLDFLAFLSKLGGKKIIADTIILHSMTCLEQIKPYLQNYGYKQVYSWMTNDEAGLESKRFIQNLVKSEEGLSHKKMNNLYKPFKNVLTWYVQRIHKGR